MVAESIQELHKNHFAGHNLFRRVILGSGDSLSVKLIARIEQRNPVARVSEDLLHPDTLELP